METNQILEEIRDINLSYLLLAKQMLRDDKVSAVYRLGINQDLAEILDKLSSAQLIKWRLQICCFAAFVLMTV